MSALRKIPAVFATLFIILWTLPAAAANDRHEMAFIEDNVADYQVLVDGVKQGTEVHVLDAGKNGLAQIAGILYGRSGIDAIHIISHGAQGSLFLGSDVLSAESLERYRPELRKIGASIRNGGEILLYGCDIAAPGKGERFVERLAGITGKRVEASSNPTGSNVLGGDWVLEVARGPASAGAHDVFSPAAREGFKGLLATYTVTNNAASGPGSFSDTFAAASASGPNTINFDPAAFDPATRTVAERTITLAANLAVLTTSIAINGDVNGDLIPDVILNGGEFNGIGSTTVGISVTLQSMEFTNFLASAAANPTVLRVLASPVFVTISDCLFYANTRIAPTQGGGALLVMGNGATLSIDRSVFYSNRAALNGGAIYFTGTGGGVISNSVFYDNQADGTAANNGGGAIRYQAAAGGSPLSLYNVTIVGNRVPNVLANGGGIQGSSTAGAILNIYDSIIVDNTGPGGASNDTNAIAAGGSVNPTNVTTGAGAGLFVNEGSGASRDLRLTGGSAAIDTGSAASPSPNATYDVLGNPRKIGTNVDRGAYEFDPTPPTVTDAKISISGGTGTGGAFKVGDIVTATWNNTAGGDNNAGITGVTMNFSAFGGGAAVTAIDDGNGNWTATCTIAAGAIDATNRNVSVTATTASGNATTADTTNATVDNQAPAVAIGSPSASVVKSTGTSDFGITYTGASNINLTAAQVSLTQTGTASCTKTVLNGTTATPSVRLSACSGDGTVTITLASAASDAAGNADAGAGPGASVTVDNAAPVVAIGSPSASVVKFDRHV